MHLSSKYLISEGTVIRVRQSGKKSILTSLGRVGRNFVLPTTTTDLNQTSLPSAKLALVIVENYCPQ